MVDGIIDVFEYFQGAPDLRGSLGQDNLGSACRRRVAVRIEEGDLRRVFQIPIRAKGHDAERKQFRDAARYGRIIAGVDAEYSDCAGIQGIRLLFRESDPPTFDTYDPAVHVKAVEIRLRAVGVQIDERNIGAHVEKCAAVHVLTVGTEPDGEFLSACGHPHGTFVDVFHRDGLGDRGEDKGDQLHKIPVRVILFPVDQYIITQRGEDLENIARTGPDRESRGGFIVDIIIPLIIITYLIRQINLMEFITVSEIIPALIIVIIIIKKTDDNLVAAGKSIINHEHRSAINGCVKPLFALEGRSRGEEIIAAMEIGLETRRSYT